MHMKIHFLLFIENTLQWFLINDFFQHLESAPKDILGDFPRLTREAAQALVFKTEAKHKGWMDDLDDDLPEHLRNQVCLRMIIKAQVSNMFVSFDQ